MLKKAIILYVKEKPVAIYSIKEMSSSDFLTIQKNCESNLKELLMEHEREKNELEQRIRDLEKDVRMLKGEDE